MSDQKKNPEELTEEDLEAVSGGSGFHPFCRKVTSENKILKYAHDGKTVTFGIRPEDVFDPDM